MSKQVICPECETSSEGEYCKECGSLLHPDHVEARKDKMLKEWAAKIVTELIVANEKKRKRCIYLMKTLSTIKR